MKTKLFTILLFLAPFLTQAQIINEFIPIEQANATDSVTKDLHSLEDLVGNARIVMLGEPDHESGTVTEAKISVLKHLHQQMGFNLIAFESGFYDLDQANTAIKNEENVQFALASSIFPIWVNTQEFQPLVAYISANKKSLHVAGFDNQFSGNYAFENLRTDIEKLTANSIPEAELDGWMYVVETMADSYNYPKSYNFKSFQKQHETVEAAIRKSKSTHTKDGERKAFFLQLLSNINRTAEDYYYNSTDSKSKEEWQAKDSNVRDSLMAANLIYLAKMYPDKKIVCWGANAHFANKVWQLQSEELKAFKPMGSYLKKELGVENVFILGFTGTNTTAASTATIESELANSGARPGILNLKTLPAGTQFSSTCLSPTEEPVFGEWKGVFDGLYYVGVLAPTTYYVPEFGTSPGADLPDAATPTETVSVAAQEAEATVNRSTYKIIRGTGENLLIYSGNIQEEGNKKAIAYANIGIRGTYIGTASDVTGGFTLKVPKEHVQDSVHVSCIGYQERVIAVKDLAGITDIILSPSLQSLKEVQVSAERLTADKIMKRTVQRIKQNYLQEPYTQKRLYRKRSYNESDGNFYLQEAIYDVYDDNGYQSVMLYPIRYTGFSRLLQAREAQLDTVSGKVGEYKYSSEGIWGHLKLSDLVDVRNNNFLSRGLFRKYEFEFTDVLETDAGVQFLISFRAQKPTHRSTATLAPISYSGTILINASDYAIVKIESTVIQDKDRVAWSDNNPAYESEAVWYQKEVVNYSKIGKHYFLENLYLTSNWNMRNNGFIEVQGLRVKPGKQERPTDKPTALPKNGVYDASKWIGVESNTQ